MLAAAAARHDRRRTPRRRSTASRSCGRRDAGRPRCPGPPPTALVANLPYNVSVPVLLHLLALLPSLERGLVMVQAEVADRLAARTGLEDLRRPVGQGRLVRRRTPGRRDRAQRLLAGAQRRLRPGRLDPPRPAAHHRRPASRSSRSSTRRSPSAARRCAAPCARSPAPREAVDRRPGRAPGIDPIARGEVARPSTTSSGSPRRWPDERLHPVMPDADRSAPRRRSTSTSVSARPRRTASTR